MDSLILQGEGSAGLRSGAAVVLSRRAPVDLEGSFTNTFGAKRALASWQPVAGLRPGDADWFELLCGEGPDSRDSMEVAGSHEG